ncbi:MAG: hypothetical protein WD359_02550 [Dehalococcoidia bacterium]
MRENSRVDWIAVALEFWPIPALLIVRSLEVAISGGGVVGTTIFYLSLLPGLGWWRVAGLSPKLVAYAVVRAAVMVFLPTLFLWVAIRDAQCDDCLSASDPVRVTLLVVWMAAGLAPIASAYLIGSRHKRRPPIATAAHAG